MNKLLTVCLLSVLSAFILYLGFWFLISNLFFQSRLDFRTLLWAASFSATEKNHILITLGALILLFLSVLLIYSILTDFISSGERVMRGQRLISQLELSKRAGKKCAKSTRIIFGGVPFPDKLHGRHSLILGPTGSGKTTAFYCLIQGIQARGERMIILDPNGDYFSRFAQDSDVLLNPFDRRTVNWDPFNDVHSELDADSMAKALIPPLHNRNEEWASYARTFIAHCMTACQRNGDSQIDSLLEILLSPNQELKRFLDSKYLPGFFNDGAVKALASSIFTIGTRLQVFRHVFTGDFSIRSWINKGKGNLYLTWRSEQLPVLGPFFTTILEVVLRSLMSSDRQVPTWLLIDEVGQLEQLASLKDTVTFGRGRGIRVVVGLQSNSQLCAIYGPDDTKIILANLSNSLILGSAHHDFEQAKTLADSFGQVEVLSKQYTNPTNGNGVGSVTSVRRWEPVVRPEEISSLPLGQGFLKLAGSLPAARVTVPNVQPKIITKAFIPRIQGGKVS